jgi:L-threonylcarbamoyladenylate synthase
MAPKLGAKFPKKALKLAQQLWPGGLTLIVPSSTASMGLRHPDHPLIQAIIERVGEPLTATSANLSGQPTLTEVTQLNLYFNDSQPDLVIDAGHIDGTPSTVVSCLQPETVVVREGMISRAQVKEITNHA